MLRSFFALFSVRGHSIFMGACSSKEFMPSHMPGEREKCGIRISDCAVINHAPEGGFVVAYLKRALSYLHQAIGLTDTVASRALLSGEEIAAYRNDLFSVREEILQLMERFRRQTP
jgi:hypothetical protein